MVTKDYTFHPKKLQRGLKSTLYDKLKAVGKCYSILEFKLNKSNSTFEFKKVYKIRGVRMEDSKTCNGTYSVENLSEEECKLTINIF